MIVRQLGEAQGIPTQPVPDPPAKVLDAQARAVAFDFVWNTINERYHDATLNGVDWAAMATRYRPVAIAAKDDDAFWDLLDRMTGELKDAHTRVDSPARVELRKRDETVTLGFSFVPLDGQLAVTSVHPESDAWWAGVRPGMTIATIAGEPAQRAYERLMADTRYDSTDRSRHLRALRRLSTGAEGSTIDIGFQRADGTRIDARVTRRKLSTRPAASHRILPSGFGYLRLTQWTLGVTGRTLTGLEAVKDTPGLVVDLRGNPGGSVHAVNAMLDRFFAVRTDLGHTTTRTGRPVALLFGAVEIVSLKSFVGGNKDAYSKPVVILVDAGSASGSELFAGSMQAAGRAMVVGQPSCGCLLGFLGYTRVPGGGELAYSEVGFVLANGKRIEGVGVIPDHPVPLTLADLRASRDRPLETAQDLLRAAAAK
jgi:carboxyl-terminal processing protease